MKSDDYGYEKSFEKFSQKGFRLLSKVQKMIHRYIGHSPKKIVKTFSKRCLPRVPDAYSKAGQFNPSDLPIYQSSSPQLWELLRHIYFHIHDIMTSTSSKFIARGLTSSPWGGEGCHRYCVLRTLNVFVCCCCVGSDRVAGVRGMQALDLMRDDGRLCLR